ncbi:hypothetical protein [Streptomyces sp. NPDC059893]|uniref:hypothetical protein n=1 Tax=Streptomyces sp. NPDC059893 TaxID=3346990 RepID=UPI003668154D
MEPLPTPCPADRVPDATGLDALRDACKAAKDQRVAFIAVERQGPRWMVQADTLTAPQHIIDPSGYDAVRGRHPPHPRTRDPPRLLAGPVCFVLYDVDGEGRARELAAALHAALYGDLEPLARAVSPTS